ncbi:MAG: hypothetical protein F6K19_22580 [Cyanothece sp. SIO1E1]|nr:hypothetical protein [Cyanothece sp. SIO1E1]
MNRPETTVRIESQKVDRVVYQSDTFSLERGRLELEVLRSPSPLQLFVQDDSSTVELRLSAKNSAAYWLNLLYNGGIGLWWERDSFKRYTYPKQVFIEKSGEKVTWRRFNPTGNKGDCLIQFSIPYVNQFYFQPIAEQGSRSSTGFLGIGLGLEYYLQDQQLMQLSFNAAMDFFLPFPAPVDFVGEYESFTTVYGNLSHQFHKGRWRFGYGLGIAQNTWRLNQGIRGPGVPAPPTESELSSHWRLGAVLPISYQLNGTFHLGLQYRPSFIGLEEGMNTYYEHLVSLELLWKWHW